MKMSKMEKRFVNSKWHAQKNIELFEHLLCRLSHGPIYLWYPLLKELRNQGMRSGLVAVFLYNRAIKIPLLPLMVYYFGAIFVVVLLIYMIIASMVEGEIIEMIVK